MADANPMNDLAQAVTDTKALVQATKDHLLSRTKVEEQLVLHNIHTKISLLEAKVGNFEKTTVDLVDKLAVNWMWFGGSFILGLILGYWLTK